MGTEVVLHVYDLSQGMAAQMSPMLLGKQIDGIWHTGIVAFGREYYFGGGICVDAPGCTPYGTPRSTHRLGTTRRSSGEFADFLGRIGGRFTVATYHILENNCNNFSNECAQFLTGGPIPSYILDLPNEVMSTPQGQAFRPFIESMQGSIRDASAGHELVSVGGKRKANAEKQPPQGAPSPAAPSALLNLSKTCIRITKSNVDAVRRKLADFDASVDPELLDDLFRFLEVHPVERSFPALDLLSLAVLDADKAVQVTPRLEVLFERFVLEDEDIPRPAMMMAMRIGVNATSSEKGADACFERCQLTLVEASAKGLEHEHAQVRYAACALALNLSAASRRRSEALAEASAVRLVCSIADFLQGESGGGGGQSDGDGLRLRPEPEIELILGALGALISVDEGSRVLARTLEIDMAKYVASGVAPKVATAARELEDILCNSTA